MTARIVGYVTRAEWGALPPKDTTPLDGRRMTGTVVHNGGSGILPASHSTCISRWRGYQRMHLAGDRGPQNDIAYNDGICGHGWVFEGRGMYLQGGANGTRTANRAYFSVCIIGEGDANYTPEARDALEWVILRNRTEGNAGDEVKRHKDFFATSCPGPKYSAFASSLHNKPIDGATDPTRPRLGDRGEMVATVQALLAAAGYTLDIDGVFGEQTDAAVRDFQTKHGLEVDGIVGPDTMTALAATAPTSEEDELMALTVRNPVTGKQWPAASALWSIWHYAIAARDTAIEAREIATAIADKQLSDDDLDRIAERVAAALKEQPADAPAPDEPTEQGDGYVSGVSKDD